MSSFIYQNILNKWKLPVKYLFESSVLCRDAKIFIFYNSFNQLQDTRPVGFSKLWYNWLKVEGDFSSYWRNLVRQCYWRIIATLGDKLNEKTQGLKNAFIYGIHVIITHSWFETSYHYKPWILGPRTEEFPSLLHKLSVKLTSLQSI